LVLLPDAFFFMHTDVLIIGQGIAGTLLSYELMRAGKSAIVIDKPSQNKASLVASAVINPLIGKNWTVAKDADELIPAAIKAYKAFEEQFNARFLSQKQLLIFHQNKNEELNFAQQIAERNPYLNEFEEKQLNVLKEKFLVENAVGKVNPVYTVDAISLLIKWRNYLQKQNSFLEEEFDFESLNYSKDKVQYKDISAEKIVFCEGAVGRENPFFPNQNFTANRGDVLLLSIPELNNENLYQRGIRLVPRNDGLFWCGSNYTWKYDSLLPEKNWRLETEEKLKNWLKIPFEITEHLVAERPTTAGQIPVLAHHEMHKNLYSFNGLGTRGFSAGPSLAREMASLMLNF